MHKYQFKCWLHAQLLGLEGDGSFAQVWAALKGRPWDGSVGTGVDVCVHTHTTHSAPAPCAPDPCTCACHPRAPKALM